MLKQLLSLTKEKHYFTIDKEKDFYYRVLFKNTDFAYTRTKDQAESMVDQVKTMVDWKTYRSINDLYQKDITEYEKVLKVLKKYAVSVKKNGNYRNELKETGILTYRLDFKGKVVAKEELAPGVALRQAGDEFLVDLILVGKTYKTFSSEEKAKLFVKKTQSWMPWHEEDVLKIIDKEKEISQFLKKLEWEIENDEPLSKPSAEVVSDFLFRNFGENNAEKKAVYRESIKKLDKMVGLKQIKDYTQTLYKMIFAEEKLRALGIGDSSPEMHALFVGPPGTGKTEVARIYADILWSLGKVPDRKLVEVSKEDLVSPYIGETEKKTKEVIERAMGGVMFLDEAYMLANKVGSNGSDYGKIALEVIMRATENYRGQFVVIFAGYEQEIEKLLEINQGLRSRFSKKFFFEDYSAEELFQIAKTMIKSAGFDANEVEDELLRVIKQKQKKGDFGGNARDIRKMVGQVVENHKLRIVDGGGDYFKIHPEDILKLTKRQESRTEETLQQMQEEAVQKLDKLVGLNELKKEIKTWSNYIKAEKMRSDLNMTSGKISLHMAFKGSPGTGKTTVARIVGEILKSNGLLSRGHFKEVGRSDLVAEYMGQTATKVQQLMKEMEGGVILIDEAYSLVQNENDTFGREAVDTLIAEAENRREDLAIIVAGYPDKIDKLFESNAGFVSRFPNQFFFPDYSAGELFELLKIELKSHGSKLSPTAEQAIEKFIHAQNAEGKTGGDGGNGRWVRNVIDQMKKKQADRLAQTNNYTEETLSTFELEDIPN